MGFCQGTTRQSPTPSGSPYVVGTQDGEGILELPPPRASLRESILRTQGRRGRAGEADFYLSIASRQRSVPPGVLGGAELTNTSAVDPES